MDVADFVRVHQRMCDNYDLCRGCPMDGICVPCTEAVYKDPQGVVEIVEKWSKEHPFTNADKFKEVFGWVGIDDLVEEDEYGCINAVPSSWWREEYKAPKEDNE